MKEEDAKLAAVVGVKIELSGNLLALKKDSEEVGLFLKYLWRTCWKR